MVAQRYWFIAVVPNNTEKTSAEKLAQEYEIFLPTQSVVSVWKNGQRKMRERILFPGKVLIHCTEQERRETMSHTYVKRYMVDIASKPNEFGRRKVAVIPDDQIERLKFVLGQTDAQVEIDNTNLQVGEKVRVVRGALCGLEGIIAETSSTAPKVHINIEHLGCACVKVSMADIERA